MQSVVTVIEPAKDISLISLRDAKLGLNLFSVSNQNTDDQIQMMIEWTSGTIADMCNRTLARERVTETLLEFNINDPRLPLSHFPISTRDGITVTEEGVVLTPDVDYLIDSDTGMLVKLDGTAWLVPTVVEYVGGYDLPFEAPQSLRQATILLTREAYNAAIRGDSTIRSIGHKEARVIYFDPNAAALKAASAGTAQGTPAMRSATALVQGFTKYWL